MPLAAVIAIAVVAVLVVAALSAWLLGYPRDGLSPLRASASEAGERAADLAADFADWVKLGR